MTEILNTPPIWGWLSYTGSIIAVAVLAVAVIWATTRSNIAAMAEAAGRALAQADQGPRALAEPAPSFVTTASARMRVGDDLFLLRVERRFHGDDAVDDAREALGACIQAFLDAGMEPDDVLSEAVDAGDPSTALAVACVLARGEAGTRLSGAALSAGFREDKGRRREAFSLDDARDLLGRRAIERSRANAETMRSALDLRASLDLVGAELVTEADDEAGRTVTMRARATWRVAA